MKAASCLSLTRGLTVVARQVFGISLLTVVARASAIPLPTINTNNIINVTNAPYNAVGDGMTTNTTAIQNAINAAALGGATNGLSGGTVEIPAGVFLSGPLTMKSFVNLQIDVGGELQMLPYGSYPGGTSPTDFISASKLSNIEISGGGIIDGQGAAWWTAYNAGDITNRPAAMFAPAACNPVFIRDVTLQNPPNTHISFRSSNHVPCGNVTVSNLTIHTIDGTPNTDGIDMSATNVLVVNSRISDGDDHIAMGDSSASVGNITVSNCVFGTGHGVSIGSYTTGGLSNLLVVNCTWSNSENGIRLKSERGRGGLCQMLTYQNLTMTNVQWPILIYSYYNYGVGTLHTATPYMAATDSVQSVTGTTPIWRNITFSNVTATMQSGQPPVMIWGLPEMLISNVTLRAVNLTGGTQNNQIYYASGVQLIDCSVPVSTGQVTFQLYGAQLTVTNSAPVSTLVSLNGLTTNGIGNSLAFYNAKASLQNTNVLAIGSLTLGGSTFTVSNNFKLYPSNVVNYALGTSPATIVVKGNLTLGGTNNLVAGTGFTNGSYQLMTYTGTLTGTLPTLGIVPAGFVCALNTNTANQVDLTVNLASFFVSTNLNFQVSGNQLQLSWPPDHLGWHLQVQTNALSNGLGTNWADWRITTNVIATNLVINPANGAVFFRLVYP